jgi:hypothetical protein
MHVAAATTTMHIATTTTAIRRHHLDDWGVRGHVLLKGEE